jgi:hypothetical protein
MRGHELRHELAAIIVIAAFTLQSCYALTQPTGIVVSDGNTVTVEDVSPILTGNIVIQKNSTLIFRNVALQLSVRGEASYNITVADRSSIVLRNSSITSLGGISTIRIANYSYLTLDRGSSLNGFRQLRLENASSLFCREAKLGIDSISGSTRRLDFVKVDAAKTVLNISALTTDIYATQLKDLYLSTVQLGITDVRFDTLLTRCVNARMNGAQGQRMNINATGQVYVSTSNVKTSGVYTPTNTTIVDSTFGTLTAGLKGNLYNVTTLSAYLTKAGGAIYTYNGTDLERYWKFEANIADLTFMPVPASVEIRDNNMTLVDTVKAGPFGRAETLLLAEITTNSTPLFVGNYKVSAHYKNYVTKQENLLLNGNKRMNLNFPDEIPGLASVTLSIVPDRILVGEKVTVRGQIRAPLKDNTVELTYIGPDGSRIARATITDSEGRFTDQLQLHAAGTWRVQAYWLGGEAHSEGVAPMSKPAVFYALTRLTMFSLMIIVLPIVVISIAVIIGVAFILLKKRQPPIYEKKTPGARAGPPRKGILRRIRDMLRRP